MEVDTTDIRLRSAARVVIRDKKAYPKHLRMMLQIGPSDATKLLAQLEDLGVVGMPDRIGKREVLLTEEPDWLKPKPPAPSAEEVDDDIVTISVDGGPPSAPFKLGDAAKAAEALSAIGHRDSIHHEVSRFLAEKGAVSVSQVQRKFGVGFNRAERVLEALEKDGLTARPATLGARWVFSQTAMPLEDTPDPDRKGKRLPVKNTAEDSAVIDVQANAAGEELRQFIERVEHLEAEKKDIMEGIKEVMSEAKGRGYSTKILRKVIALRKRNPDDIAEEEAVLDMYKAALGMS